MQAYNLLLKEENANRPGVLVIIQNGLKRKEERRKKNISNKADKEETGD